MNIPNQKTKVTRSELLQIHRETSDKCRATMEKKNHDYTCGSDDVFANFQGSTFLGVEPAKGLLLRVQDKQKRIVTYIDKGALAVEGESVEDAIEDTINYMILLKAMFIQQRRERESHSAEEAATNNKEEEGSDERRVPRYSDPEWNLRR